MTARRHLFWLLALAACSPDPEPKNSEQDAAPPQVDVNPANASALSEERRAVVGCWQTEVNSEHLEYRFGSDGRTVLNRDLIRNQLYLGSYAMLDGNLTIDFGEEANMTYRVEVTPNEIHFTELSVTYARAECLPLN